MRTYNASMSLTLPLAHRRYVQQAGWTAALRRHLFARAGLPNARRVLDIGCGTGAVLRDIAANPSTQLHGLDLDRAALHIAEEEAPATNLTGADALALPYAANTFDISFFHFVLLWVQDPARALAEARRVTRSGGAVIAFAEPDYTQRVDQPASLVELGRLQTEALRAQGADIGLGGKLATIFAAAGLNILESGQLEKANLPVSEDKLEWEVLHADLSALVPDADLDRFASEYAEANAAGLRVSHVPTFYAMARVA